MKILERRRTGRLAQMVQGRRSDEIVLILDTSWRECMRQMYALSLIHVRQYVQISILLVTEGGLVKKIISTHSPKRTFNADSSALASQYLSSITAKMEPIVEEEDSGLTLANTPPD